MCACAVEGQCLLWNVGCTAYLRSHPVIRSTQACLRSYPVIRGTASLRNYPVIQLSVIPGCPVIRGTACLHSHPIIQLSRAVTHLSVVGLRSYPVFRGSRSYLVIQLSAVRHAWAVTRLSFYPQYIGLPMQLPIIRGMAGLRSYPAIQLSVIWPACAVTQFSVARPQLRIIRGYPWYSQPTQLPRYPQYGLPAQLPRYPWLSVVRPAYAVTGYAWYSWPVQLPVVIRFKASLRGTAGLRSYLVIRSNDQPT